MSNNIVRPKPFLDNIMLRKKAYGKERRRNITKIVLENGTPFPQEVSYKDIDAAFKEFVDKSLSISYDGDRLPTFNLFSTQKISEYSQSWEHLDDMGNIIMNFKTITRDNNPQKGTQYSNLFNIPGNRDYAMFLVPKLQENGQQAYDMYTMKQPMPVDFIYRVSIVTNKYELLNEFNELVNYQFKALQCYIAPNGYYMSMILNSVTDESEYTIDGRKFYSQSFEINLRGYIIRKEDFQVHLLPTRRIFVIEGEAHRKKPKSTVDVKENYKNKEIIVECNFDKCEKNLKFKIDCTFKVNEIRIDNVYDFVIMINGEKADFDFLDELDVEYGDELEVKIEKEEDDKPSQVLIIGYDKNIFVSDKELDTESPLDEQCETEIIEV